ncbi:hypothetical protein VXQ18_08915 [Brucella abortus]|nr:hypothetical protein [Brucella abortus]
MRDLPHGPIRMTCRDKSNGLLPFPSPPPAWHQGLSPLDILCLLDLADQEIAVSRQPEKKKSVPRGRTQINLFFEASTRTQSSFRAGFGKTAGRGCDEYVRRQFIGQESERLIDTAMTLERHAAGYSRHPPCFRRCCRPSRAESGLLGGQYAGDGAHEHPHRRFSSADNPPRRTRPDRKSDRRHLR